MRQLIAAVALAIVAAFAVSAPSVCEQADGSCWGCGVDK